MKGMVVASETSTAGALKYAKAGDGFIYGLAGYLTTLRKKGAIQAY